MNSMLEYFIEDAKALSVADVTSMIGLNIVGHNGEHAGPCPVCGGKDRFSYNTRKNAWNCRGCGTGGRGGLGLVAHVNGFDLHRRTDFIAACAAALGRDAPVADSETESPEVRRKREKDWAARQEKTRKDAEKRDQAQNAWRDRERQRAREKWQKGRLLSSTQYVQYLALRCGGTVTSYPLRLLENEPYFVGNASGGKPAVIHKGPTMVAPFVNVAGDIIGCHLTWLDLQNGPKYRPALVDDRTGDAYPSKKMRGSKKGGIVPLAGFFLSRGGIFKADNRRRRMVLGEGIETVLAMRLAEGDRADTIYAAAGDLGNMVGPADPQSRFYHPELTVMDKAWRQRPKLVPGPVPADMTDQSASAWIPDWVSELVLIADSDSEPVMTAAAMCRGRTRHAAHRRRIVVVWPPRGRDVADMMAVINSNGTDA